MVDELPEAMKEAERLIEERKERTKKVYLTYGQEDTPEGFTRFKPNEYFDPDTIEELRAQHVLDKIPSLWQFFQQLSKSMKVGAKATFHEGYFRDPRAWISPYTVRGISELSLCFLSKDWREANKWAAPDTGFVYCDFEVQWGIATDPILETKSPDAKAFAMANYSGSISSVQFVVTKK